MTDEERRHEEDLQRIRGFRLLDDDFRCTDSRDMYFTDLAKRVSYFKETDEGVNAMCKVIEDMRNETAWATKVEDVKGMIEANLSYDLIAQIAKLTVDQVREIAGEKSA